MARQPNHRSSIKKFSKAKILKNEKHKKAVREELKTKKTSIAINGKPMPKPLVSHSGLGIFNANTSFMKRTFGCVACSWKGTSNCPHGLIGDQHHANYICSQRMLLIKEISDMYKEVTGKRLSLEKGTLVVQYYDDKLWSDRMLQDLIQNGDKAKYRPMEVLAWRKHVSDMIQGYIKQEEGSKVTIEKNAVDRMRSVIDVTPKDQDDKK